MATGALNVGYSRWLLSLHGPVGCTAMPTSRAPSAATTNARIRDFVIGLPSFLSLIHAHRSCRRAQGYTDRSLPTRSHQGVLLAIASGVLLALSFPRFGHPAF